MLRIGVGMTEINCAGSNFFNAIQRYQVMVNVSLGGKLAPASRHDVAVMRSRIEHCTPQMIGSH